MHLVGNRLRLYGCCGGLFIQFSLFLHRYIDQASVQSLRPSLSQCDKWLLTYRGGKVK